MSLLKPFVLGTLKLPSNILCAPLAGCSDLPFRRMTSRYRPGLIYCEMVKMDALVRYDTNTFRYLDYEADMHPIGAQLCGSKPEYAAQSARIIESLGFDVIDLNCGCPVDKVTKDGSGSGLLKTPERIGEILSNIRAAVKIPVTVKIRAGWDENQINAVEIMKIAEKAGASAICIHGRTREQGYQGAANWDHIRDCKREAKTIQVIGNGDLFDPEAVKQMLETTGCDAVLIARGTMGKPWIVDDVYRLLSGEPPIVRTGADYRIALLEHFNHIVGYQRERKALLDMRRVGCWYLTQAKGAKALREALNQSKSMEEVRAVLEGFPWELLEV